MELPSTGRRRDGWYMASFHYIYSCSSAASCGHFTNVVDTYLSHSYIHTYMHARVCACVHTNTHTHTHTCAHTHTHNSSMEHSLTNMDTKIFNKQLWQLMVCTLSRHTLASPQIKGQTRHIATSKILHFEANSNHLHIQKKQSSSAILKR